MKKVANIVALVLIVVSIVLWKQNPVAFSLLALGAGYSLMDKRNEHLLHLTTKREGGVLFLTALFDMLNVALIVGLSKVWVYLYNVFVKTPLLGPIDLTSQGLASLDKATAQLHLTVTFIVASFAVIVLAIASMLVVHAITRRLTWQVLRKQQPIKKTILYFFAWAAMSIPFFLLSITQKEPLNRFSLVVFLLLYAHLTTIGHAHFFRHGKIGRAIRTAFGVGIVKIAMFITPYTYLLAAYYVIGNVFGYLTTLLKVQGMVANIVFVILFLAWARYYVANVIREERID